jgi:ABC-type ATPase with predicted acetyltransferase domain
LAKLQLTEALGPVKIKSLNANGEIVETWELHGAYITSMKPSQLSYDQDSLTNISVAVKYDFATLAVADAAAASGDPFAAWKSD